MVVEYRVHNHAAFIAMFKVFVTLPDGTTTHRNSGNLLAGRVKTISMPDGVTGIEVQFYEDRGAIPFSDSFHKFHEEHPPDSTSECYTITGALGSAHVKSC